MIAKYNQLNTEAVVDVETWHVHQGKGRSCDPGESKRLSHDIRTTLSDI